jgi:hypothetical protein
MKNGTKKKRDVGRLSVVFAVCIAMIMTSAVTALGTSLTLTSQKTVFPTNEMTYSFEFKEPKLGAIDSNGAIYTMLSMPGCLSIGAQTGEPTIPVKPITLLLPPMKTVSQITVSGTPISVSTSPIDLKKKPIFPYQPSVPLGSTDQPAFTMNNDLYSSSALYPPARYSDSSIGYSHGYAILNINLNPLQYNPRQGTLEYYPELTVQITLTDAAPNQFYRNNADDAAWVKNLVSNPEIENLYEQASLPTFEYPGGLCTPSNSYDYVIVTTTQNGLDYWATSGSLPYNWDSLLAYHASDGISGTLVTRQAIDACADYQNGTPLFNDAQAHIREFCKDAYQDWGTEYVLIAGDADTIPARQMKTAYESNIDADIYWSNLDLNFNADGDTYWGEEGDSGFDLYSELYIGRLTCDVPQDVSNWMTKSMYYAQSTQDTYLDNAAFYGGDTTWSCQGDDFEDYGAIKGTTNWLGPDPNHDGPFPTWAGFQYGFETWNAVNEGNQFNLSVKWTAEPPNPGGWLGGSTSAAIAGLKNAINNDQVTLLSGIAHANPSMSLDVQSTDWESQYTNTKPFFIHDFGCHCGDFSAADDGVLHSMLFHSDTELAFACVYNTCYGWGNLYCTNSSSAFQQKEFWDYFFDTENNSGDLSNWQLGKGQAWSKDRMAPTINWDYSDGTWRAIIQGCLLFGDPAQTIRTPHPSQSPLKPATPNGPNSGIWNAEYSYTSSSTDPENEQIYYLFNWDDGSNSGWLGPYASGQTVTGSHIWTVLGTYSVTVKARDIWGAGSPLSDPITVVITDNTPPDTPTITGPTNIKPHVAIIYTLSGTDDQNQDLTYYIDWGDGNAATGIGPHHSGETFTLSHTWNIKGTYTIKTRTTDTAGAQSEWATIDVVAPTDYHFSLNAFFQHLLEMFPHAFPILRNIMGY